jgi:hypothetical protein
MVDFLWDVLPKFEKAFVIRIATISCIILLACIALLFFVYVLL